jgi:DNA-binding response OmpR family regulator
MSADQISPAVEATAALPQNELNPRQHILVADEEPLIRQLNAEVLMDAGYQVDVAADGAAAWEALQVNRYDLLITEQVMTEVSGVELVKKLHLARIPVPVIMTTATFPWDELKQHPWLQIGAMLFKPYTISELLETVRAFTPRLARTPKPFAVPANLQCRITSTPRILVVDDEFLMRDLMVKTLHHFGYEQVDAASDGAEAWQALQEVRYDLVITDLKMPKVTGLELIKKMRSQAMAQPVILISGTLPIEELKRNPGLGIDAIFSKPFSAAELLGTVEKILRSADTCAVLKEKQRLKTNEMPIPPTQTQKHAVIRILLVDDDRDFRELQENLLTSSGYEVTGVNDGAAGWEALRTNDYDLVITDNRMPRMTGLEMIENLHGAHMTIPVIMATGNLPTDAFARKPWLKPKAMLQRPYTNAELLDTVRNVLDADGGKDNRKEKLLPKYL